MSVVKRLDDILKTHTTDNMEKPTAVKTARAAFLSALNGLSFPHPVYFYDKFKLEHQDVEKVILRFLSTPIFPLLIIISLKLLRMSLWKKLRILVG
jgi:hypothetical protein